LSVFADLPVLSILSRTYNAVHSYYWSIVLMTHAYFFFAGVLIKEEFPKGCVNEAVMTTIIKKGGCSFLE
jgi:hypothetical protein